MNKMIAAIATFAALGAATLGVSAFDLKGSDAMKRLTVQVVAACPDAGALVYVGGGSGAGEAAMVARTQAVSPMSRFLAGSGSNGACAVDTTRAEAIEVASDAIVITMNSTHHAACDPNQGGALDTSCQGYTPGGLSHSRTLSSGVTLSSWKDTLRLLYFGLAPNDFPLAAGTGAGDQVLAVNIARRDCEDPSRIELANNFGKLFEIDCGNDGGCTRLQHAFRHDENSGTTDVFREILGVESATQVGNKGFPFCNEYVPAVTINADVGPDNGVLCLSNANCTDPIYSVCPSAPALGTCHRPIGGCTVANSAQTCPAGFTCDPGQGQCAKTCNLGDNAACSSLIPGATCHAAGVCTPGTCSFDGDCGGAGLCDTSTGRCRMPPSKVSCTGAAECAGIGAICTRLSNMDTATGWCVKLVDAPASDAKIETRCGVPGLVGGTQPGTVATVPGEFRSATAGVGFENQQNNDPIRRQAIGRNWSIGGGDRLRFDNYPAEQVATYCGDNGLLLPVSIPRDTVKAYPNTVCGIGKYDFFPAVVIQGGASARYRLCPNGDMPLGATGWDPVIRGAIRGSGMCQVMTIFNDASNAACLNFATNRPTFLNNPPPSTYVTKHAGEPTPLDATTFDARVYNNTVWQPASQSRLTQNYDYNGLEQNPAPGFITQQVTGAFYRIHSTRTAKGYNHAATCNVAADCPAATPLCDPGTHTCFNANQAACTNVGFDGTPNVCCENPENTNQIGCLTMASPCSMGYAGLPSASCANSAQQLTTQPALGGTQVVETNFSVGLDHAAMGGVVKEVSGCGPNACIPADNLGSPPTLQYPMTRNLFISTIVGFESASLTSGEIAISQCLSGTRPLTSGTVNSLIDANGFVSGLGNIPCCRDFNEATCSATSSSSNNACSNNAAVNMPTTTCAF